MSVVSRLITHYFGKVDFPSEDYSNTPNWLSILFAFGILLPWSVLITIASECYVNFWFFKDEETWCSQKSMGSLIIASEFPDAAGNVFNLFTIIAVPLILSVFPLFRFNIFILMVIQNLVVVLEPVPDLMKPFLFCTIGLASAIFNFEFHGNSVYGVFANLPHSYIGALLIGNNMSGLLMAFVKICVTYYFYNLPKLAAIVYYSISVVILVLCAIAYLYYQQKDVKKAKKAYTHKPSPSSLWTTFRNCYGQLFNVWFCFAVTHTIFPVMMTATTRGKYGFLNNFISENNEIYTSLTGVLVFNLFAAIGFFVASKVDGPTSIYLSLAVIARVLFIPVFFFCNYRVETRAYPVFFDNTDVFVVAGILMSLSHGYLSALAMGYTPNVSPSHYSRFAAHLSICTVLIGLFTGGWCAVIVEGLVDGLKFC